MENETYQALGLLGLFGSVGVIAFVPMYFLIRYAAKREDKISNDIIIKYGELRAVALKDKLTSLNAPSLEQIMHNDKKL